MRDSIGAVLRVDHLCNRPWGRLERVSGEAWHVILGRAGAISYWERLDGWCLPCDKATVSAWMFTPMTLKDVALEMAAALRARAADGDAWPFGSQSPGCVPHPWYQALMVALVCDVEGLADEADAVWAELPRNRTVLTGLQQQSGLAADCWSRLLAGFADPKWSRAEAVAAIEAWQRCFGNDNRDGLRKDLVEALMLDTRGVMSAVEALAPEAIAKGLRADVVPELAGAAFMEWSAWRPLRAAPVHERLCSVGAAAVPALVGLLPDRSVTCSFTLGCQTMEVLSVGDLAWRTLTRIAGWPVAERGDGAAWLQWNEAVRNGDGAAWLATRAAGCRSASSNDLALYVRQGGSLSAAISALGDDVDLRCVFFADAVLNTPGPIATPIFCEFLRPRLRSFHDHVFKHLAGWPHVGVRAAIWLGNQVPDAWATAVIEEWEASRAPATVEIVGLLACEDSRIDKALQRCESDSVERRRILVAFAAMLEAGQPLPEMSARRAAVVRRILAAETRNETPWRDWVTIVWGRRPVVMLDATLGDVAACVYGIVGDVRNGWRPSWPRAHRHRARLAGRWAPDSWAIVGAEEEPRDKAEPATVIVIGVASTDDATEWQTLLRRATPDLKGLQGIAQTAAGQVRERRGELVVSLARRGNEVAWAVGPAPTSVDTGNAKIGEVEWVVDVVVDGRHLASGHRWWRGVWGGPAPIRDQDAVRVRRALEAAPGIDFEIRMGFRAPGR